MERPDMMIIGKRIRQLRRERGMYVAEFARQIKQPVWLVMLVENAHTECAREPVELLPIHVVDKMLQEIENNFGVTRSWLTTCDQFSLPEEQPQPPVLLLPISLEPEDVMHCIDDILSLASSGNHADDLTYQSIVSLMLLYRLQLTLQQQSKSRAWATGERERLHQLIQARIEALMSPAVKANKLPRHQYLQ